MIKLSSSLIITVTYFSSLFASETKSPETTSPEIASPEIASLDMPAPLCEDEGISRQKMLFQWDEAMNWVMPFSSRTFSLIIGEKPIVYKETDKALEEFVSLHGYFACYKPLVGIVTEEIEDVDPIQKVFNSLIEQKNAAWMELATNEVLCKALSYRNLKKGMKISIPIKTGKKMALVEYEVDEVLDLWQGMPAFGLISQNKEAFPLLLFRGTDFSFTSKSSWASIVSDLDLAGAGLSTFYSSQKKIQGWLGKASLHGQKAQVMGFSLGGILATYTAIFESSHVDRCVAFNAPGVSKSIFNMWKHQSLTCPIYIYATQGDLISRFGKMVAKAYEVSDRTPMGPIEAHTKIMCAKPPTLLFQIDVEKENSSRFRAE
jgi:hypothetical protein